jgi:hypothetical protein
MPSRMPAIASRMAVRKNKDGIDIKQPSSTDGRKIHTDHTQEEPGAV